MGTGSSEEDTFVMKDTRLSELLEDEKQKLIYVFDPLTERVFFIELSEIITGKDLEHAVCSRKEGNPPKQTVDFDEQMKADSSLDLDENFYGDQEYDMEDFDPDGYDIGSGTKINTNFLMKNEEIRMKNRLNTLLILHSSFFNSSFL